MAIGAHLVVIHIQKAQPLPFIRQAKLLISQGDDGEEIASLVKVPFISPLYGNVIGFAKRFNRNLSRFFRLHFRSDNPATYSPHESLQISSSPSIPPSYPPQKHIRVSTFAPNSQKGTPSFRVCFTSVLRNP